MQNLYKFRIRNFNIFSFYYDVYFSVPIWQFKSEMAASCWIMPVYITRTAITLLFSPFFRATIISSSPELLFFKMLLLFSLIQLFLSSQLFPAHSFSPSLYSLSYSLLTLASSFQFLPSSVLQSRTLSLLFPLSSLTHLFLKPTRIDFRFASRLCLSLWTRNEILFVYVFYYFFPAYLPRCLVGFVIFVLKINKKQRWGIYSENSIMSF